jgi:hypothetical protein
VAAKGPTRFVVIRDSILLAGGMLGIGYQQVTGNVNQIFLAIYFAMLGLPGLTSGQFLLKMFGEQPPSSSPSSSQPTQSSSSQEQ